MPSLPPLPPIRAPRIEWPTAVVLCALFAALFGVWALSSPEQRATLLTGVASVGGVALSLMRALLSAQRPPAPPPPPHANGLDRDALDDVDTTHLQRNIAPVVAVVLAGALSGCSPSALRTHQTIATIARVSVVAAHPAIVSACETLMSRCTDDACLERVGHDCEAAAVARDTAHAAVRAYVDTIQIAAHADEGRVAPALDLALSTLARVYDAAREAIARTTGYQLPGLPPEALPILRALTAGAVEVLGGGS